MKITIADICRSTAAHFGLSVAELLGESREQQFARPRQIAMVLCRENTGWSLCQIAGHFNRDHTTLLHAMREFAPGTRDGIKSAADRSMILGRATALAKARDKREREWVAKLHAGVPVKPPAPVAPRPIKKVVYDRRLFIKPARPTWYAKLGPSAFLPSPDKLRAGRA